MRRHDIYRTITDHCGFNAYNFVRYKIFQLFVLMYAYVATAYKLKAVPDIEEFQYSLSEIDPLRCAYTQLEPFPDQVTNSFRYAWVENILRVADICVPFTEFRYELYDI